MADSYKTLICPACGKEMKKIFISEIGISLDICADGCGGIYFDNRELKKMDEQHEHLDEFIQEIENKDFSNVQVDEDADRICPACGAKMVKNSTSVNNNIIIDECYSCGGKFFDHGELSKFRAEYATEKERSEAVIKAFVYSPEGSEMNYLSKKSVRVNIATGLGNTLSKIFFR
ncbi:zf-TFIIB domain-containing protein [bacterium]|nr:zf-TFIIB domain-containing protein [bacterium]MBR6302028.1 zf-TFIIB domain-containing protein [bacterium]